MKVDTDVKGNPLGCEVYVDERFYRILKRQYGRIKNKFDSVWGIVGDNGVGKSWFAQQIGVLWDKDFSLKNIVFTDEQFYEAIDTLPKGSVIIYDESDVVAQHHFSQDVNKLARVMKRIRDKLLMIIFVTPTYRDMNYYFAVTRLTFLVEVYGVPTENDMNPVERGYFQYYDSRAKAMYYDQLKKMPVVNGAKFRSGYGRFVKHPDGFPIDEVSYVDKKAEATRSLTQSKEEKKKAHLGIKLKEYKAECIDRFETWLFANFDKKASRDDVSHIFDISHSSVSRLRGENV